MSVMQSEPEQTRDERVLSWFVVRPGTDPVFLTITAHRAPGLHWYAIEACGLGGERLCKPRVFGSKRLARQRWFEATACEVLTDDVFAAVGA